MYCSQTDIENLIGGPVRLAELANDTASSSSADAAVVAAIIAQGDAMIDAKIGQVYQTPVLVPVSGTVSSSSVTITGTGTTFSTQFKIGDRFWISLTKIFTVIGLTSDTALTLDIAPSPALSAATVYRVPAIVSQISKVYALFLCFARRPQQLEIPKAWLEMKKEAEQYLEDISNMMVSVPGAVLVSAEAEMFTPTTYPIVDFNNLSGISKFADF